MLPLCEVHRRRRRHLLIAGTAGLLGCIPVGFMVRPLTGGGWGFAIGLLLFVSALVLLVLGHDILKPTYIGSGRGTFTGADNDFLQHLPEGLLPQCRRSRKLLL